MDEKLIEDVCKQTPNFDLCVSSLHSDPKSSSADVPELALIMANIINVKATSTLNHIKDLLKEGSGDRDALVSCGQNYIAILEIDLPQAIKALINGAYDIAEDGFADAVLEANFCEEGFSSGSSPLTDTNKYICDASGVARAIARLLI